MLLEDLDDNSPQFGGVASKVMEGQTAGSPLKIQQTQHADSPNKKQNLQTKKLSLRPVGSEGVEAIDVSPHLAKDVLR